MVRFFLSFLAMIQLHAAISWDTPVTLSSVSANVTDHRIVMDADGNTTIVYLEAGVLKARVCPLSGSWGAAATLSGMGAADPSSGVDASGNVTAVWSEGSVVKASTYSGSWSAATTLSSSGTILNPRIAVRSNGDMVAVWDRDGVIESATKLSAGDWGAVSTLSAASSDNPEVAIGTDGTVCAIWHTSSVSGNVVMAATKAVNGAWNAAISLMAVSPAYIHNYPRVSVDVNGNAEAVWYRYQLNGSSDIGIAVYASSLPSGAPAWSAIPTQLSNIGMGDPSMLKMHIAHDPLGNAFAVWTISYDNSSFTVESGLKILGQSWSTPGVYITQSNYSFHVDVSLNSLSDAIIAFMNFNGTNILIQEAEATVSGALSSLYWAPSATISDSSNNATPRIASVYATNNLYAGCSWIESSSGYNVLQASLGSRATLSPPTNLAIQQSSTNYGVFTDYYNTLTWDASDDANVIGYAIFRDGVIVHLAGSNISTYVEHNAVQNGAVAYGVAAVDAHIMQSATVNVSFP